MHHLNNGKCEKCESILNRYPNFNLQLAEWFKGLQLTCPEAHISWAGRGKADQELFFNRGLTRAKYGQSSHNYNAAIDLFRLTQAGGASFDSSWYKTILPPEVQKHGWLRWYGILEGKNDFYELPHVELRDWRKLVESGQLKLVEPL